MSVLCPYSANFSGTVSAPLFVSNQVLIAPVAAGTTSTLTVGSFSATFVSVSGTLSAANGSLTQAYTSTLTVGTILNFSAGGSVGTNLYLTGSISALTASLTQAYTSTLSVGTILNFSAGGSIGTNLALTGTLSAMIGNISSLSISTLSSSFSSLSLINAGTLNANLSSITTLTIGSLSGIFGSVSQAYAATLAIGTILNFFQGQTVSTAGTTAGTFMTGTMTFPVSGSFSGTLLSSGLGINVSNPAYSLDINGTARISSNLIAASNTLATISARPYNFNAGHISNSIGSITDVGVGNTGMIFSTGGCLDLVNSSTTSMLRLSGTLLGVNNTSPAYTLDVAGTARFSGSLTVNGSFVPRMQGGQSTWTSGTKTVTFNVPFTTTPSVTASYLGAPPSNANAMTSIFIYNVSTTSFTVSAFYINNSSSTTPTMCGTDNFTWIALGT